MSDRHFRDEALGVALQALEVPDHEPTFFPDLQAQLGPVRSRRWPKPRAGRVLAAMAVAGAAVVVAIVLVKIVGGEHGADVARAAQIEARLGAAVAGTRTARGELTYTARDPRSGRRTTTRQSFVLDGVGDQRLTDLSASTVSAYDARRGVERAITTSAALGSGRFYAVRAGVAPGPPDAGPSSPLLDSQLGAVVRALAAARDPRVRQVELNGRPAWRLDLAIEPNTIYRDVDHVSVTVDRATGFPLHVLTTLDGGFRSELTLDKLELNSPLPRGAFTLRFPAGAELLRTDGGFVRVGLDGVAKRVGYPPLVPASLPDGFKLVTVAAARRAEPTGPGETNPRSRDVVSLSYRRGLAQIVITTRRRGGGRWQDPFGIEGVHLESERVQLTKGAMAGAAAEVVVDARTVPHLWTLDRGLLVTVSGDLSRSQLLAVAEALR